MARHDRHGLTSECSLPTFGNLTDCADGRGQGNNDNNGLWTSLVVGAEYFRFHATNNASASASAAHFLDGMRRLHNVTGIPGLYVCCRLFAVRQERPRHSTEYRVVVGAGTRAPSARPRTRTPRIARFAHQTAIPTSAGHVVIGHEDRTPTRLASTLQARAFAQQSASGAAHSG